MSTHAVKNRRRRRAGDAPLFMTAAPLLDEEQFICLVIAQQKYYIAVMDPDAPVRLQRLTGLVFASLSAEDRVFYIRKCLRDLGWRHVLSRCFGFDHPLLKADHVSEEDLTLVVAVMSGWFAESI